MLKLFCDMGPSVSPESELLGLLFNPVRLAPAHLQQP